MSTNKIKLKANTIGYGYLTLAGTNDYGTLPADVGSLSGSFVLEYNFRPTSSFAHSVIFGKQNPSSGGAGGAVGWYIGTYSTAKIKFQWCAVEGTSAEFTGITTLVLNTDYKVRLISDGTTMTCSLSSDGGQNWTTEFTTSDSAVLTVVGASNTYPTILGRGRWAAAWTDYFIGRIGIIRIIKGSSDPEAATTHEYRMMNTGTNPALTDRRGVYHGTTTGGITGTLSQADVYANSGSIVYGGFDLSSIGSYYKSMLLWTATIVANTTITISSAITNDANPPDGYTQISQITTVGTASVAIEIPGFTIGDDLTGKYLWIKIDLATTNTASTPNLSALSLWICDRDLTQVKINLTYAGRIKNPDGEVNLNFTGALVGEGSSFVAPFQEGFTAVNYIQWFNPNDAEHLNMTDLTITPNLIPITYSSHSQPESACEKLNMTDVVITAAVYHKDNIPV